MNQSCSNTPQIAFESIHHTMTSMPKNEPHQLQDGQGLRCTGCCTGCTLPGHSCREVQARLDGLYGAIYEERENVCLVCAVTPGVMRCGLRLQYDGCMRRWQVIYFGGTPAIGGRVGPAGNRRPRFNRGSGDPDPRVWPTLPKIVLNAPPQFSCLSFQLMQ